MKQFNGGRPIPPGKRTETDMDSLMKKYYSSKGISIKAFCEQHAIREWKFYTWHKRFKSAESSIKEQQRFVPVEVMSAGEDKAPGLFAEVQGIRIYQPVSADYLKSLLP
jgi:hypothetical protein